MMSIIQYCHAEVMLIVIVDCYWNAASIIEQLSSVSFDCRQCDVSYSESDVLKA